MTKTRPAPASRPDLLRLLKERGFYYAVRLIVMLLFGSILFFPDELGLILDNPALLALMVLGPVAMAITLFLDLLNNDQKSLGSLVAKYFFLTLSVILAFGLLYYIDARILEPNALFYWAESGPRMAEPDFSHPPGALLERDVFYLSATTYFTIGFGDIVPSGHLSRTASVFEAFLGNVINLIVLSMAFQRLAPARRA